MFNSSIKVRDWHTVKDTWLGPTANLGAIGSTYNLNHQPGLIEPSI
jgi:hypothetical protein